MKKIVTLALTVLMALSANAQTTLKAQSLYDTNQDDKVSVADVSTEVKRLTSAVVTDKTVVDTDSLLKMLNALNSHLTSIDSRLSAIESDLFKIKVKEAIETHEYVDLGLPSGTLWATCNIGAETADASGSVFAFDAQTDPATAQWGSGWTVPTKAQFEELIANTTVEVGETVTGLPLYTLTSTSNSSTLTLPAAMFSAYWTSTVDVDNATTKAYYLSLTSTSPYLDVSDTKVQTEELPIRPVHK